MNAGLNGYIYGISPDKHIKAIQLWQFLGCKVLFRLSMLSNGQFVCAQCGLHTEYPSEYNMKCYNKTPLKYNLEEFPVENIVLDGYTFNKHNISGCHKYVF
jgi:hypothetical protein